MAKRALLGITLLTSLTACHTVDLPSTENTALTTTISEAKSNKLTKHLAACVDTQLKSQYPAASLTMIADALYSGKIPGTEANKPIATYEISAPTGELSGTITLKQANPNDTTIVELVKHCL